MAIRFRCPHCQTLQSIAHRKAGQLVRCAACDDEVQVPLTDDTGAQSLMSPPAESQSVVEDRVVLPDDFFDDESPVQALEPVIQPASVPTRAAEEESVEFAAAPDEPPVELPPVRSRSEELPEEFQLQIRGSKIDDEMDLTPMVDVVFQLLIFFMVTASFALHKTIETPSPDPEQKGATQSIQTLDELEGVSILVRIDAQNGITIDDEPLNDDSRIADALRDKMRAEQKSEIIITADAATWHRTVVKVVDAANEVGMQKIRLATRSGPVD